LFFDEELVADGFATQRVAVGSRSSNRVAGGWHLLTGLDGGDEVRWQTHQQQAPHPKKQPDLLGFRASRMLGLLDAQGWASLWSRFAGRR